MVFSLPLRIAHLWRLPRHKRLNLSLVLGVLVVIMAGCTKANLDESVVVLLIFDQSSSRPVSWGTGFVVADGGYITTNRHVINSTLRNRNHLIIVLTEGKDTVRSRAEVIWSSREYDLAIVRAPKLRAPPLSINRADLEKEETVTAIGFPGAATVVDPKNKSFTISTRTRGEISRVFDANWLGLGQDVRVVQHTATINKGNSGGPLVNLCGEVVGVNTLVSRLGVGTFFASHASELAKILTVQQIPARIVSVPCNPYLGSLYTFAGVVLVLSFMAIIALRTMGFQFGQLGPVLARLSSLSRQDSGAEVTQTYFHPRAEDEEEYCFVPFGDTKNIGLPPFYLSPAKPGPIVVGRKPPASGIQISDSSISRQHVRITWSQSSPYSFYVEDLDSKNGTKINGQEVRRGDGPVPIRFGDKLQLGRTTYEFSGKADFVKGHDPADVEIECILAGKNPQTNDEIFIEISKRLLRESNNELIIGRDSQFCDIVILHPTISARGHAKINYLGSELRLSDMGSTNGTSVDNRRLGAPDGLTSIALKENMILRLGSVELRVERR